MASNDYPALVRAWRAGDDPDSAAPALLATLRRALDAASVSAFTDAAADAPRWHDPPGAASPSPADAIELPLVADGEPLGRLRLAPNGNAAFDADARELAGFAASLLAQGL